jgi:hypothetical protein
MTRPCQDARRLDGIKRTELATITFGYNESDSIQGSLRARVRGGSRPDRQDDGRGRRAGMAAKIHLNEGLAFLVNEPFEDVEHVYKEALAAKRTFRITNGTGKVHVVNPDSVVFIENVTSADPAPPATAQRAQ